jgi:predicted transcriptional regulator of viral defense system
VRTTRAPNAAKLSPVPPRHPKPPADGPISGDIGRVSAHRPPDIDGLAAELASEQHGLASLDQLKRIGFTETTIHKRINTGRLHPVQQGVYAVGHRPQTREARYMAAVLACGPDALLSHRSAVDLQGLREDRRGRIDVTAPNRRGRSPAGINAHRDGSLVVADRTEVDGIPCTSVARTLLDYAGVAPIWELRRALGEAEVLRILDVSAARDLIKRSKGRRGVARFRMVLDELHPQTRRTRSEMERMFLRLCSRAELPEPEVNVPLRIGNGVLKPDFLWRDAALIVETDSRRFHATARASLDDPRREQRLQLAGWRVSRCTWWEIEHEPRRLAETIRGLLAQAVNSSPTGRFPAI